MTICFCGYTFFYGLRARCCPSIVMRSWHMYKIISPYQQEISFQNEKTGGIGSHKQHQTMQRRNCFKSHYGHEDWLQEGQGCSRFIVAIEQNIQSTRSMQYTIPKFCDRLQGSCTKMETSQSVSKLHLYRSLCHCRHL